ncbi:cytochrome P450 [Actinoallomurus rhizosphaericola]|uniref:cytochrome P450 n=1 Tax=Actinoallomurus rhizosphaericola TaxID=2952536 RepID=UPI0020926AB5|nr:cytochrome P450 [Actinoallomurus rhizosphaericola]MCO5998063.1 cytochrome P450 [Actinoallomurus rhizosphaericola]
MEEAMSESLGDEYDPMGTHLDDPFDFYRRAQREMPVFFSSKLGVWVVTRMADVKKVMRDGRTFSSVNNLRPLEPLSMEVLPIMFSGYPLVPVFLVMDGEEHLEHRRPWAAGFTAERVEAVRPYITQRATALADELTAGESTAELMAAYANPLANSVIAHVMGIAPEDHAALGDDTRNAVKIAIGYVAPSEEEQAEAAQSWVHSQQLIGSYVDARRAEPRDDLISEAIAAYAPDGELSEDAEAELVGSAWGVTLAGQITTSAVIGAGVLRLLEHPEQWRLLCERPDMIPHAVEEILRFCAPGHLFLRQTTRDTVLAGQELPEGTEVAVCPAAANRDEAVFDRPGEFDITRDSSTGHLAFGHGPHYCIGFRLARVELEISLRVLTERLPKLRLVPGRPATWRPSLIQKGPATVPVAW